MRTLTEESTFRGTRLDLVPSVRDNGAMTVAHEASGAAPRAGRVGDRRAPLPGALRLDLRLLPSVPPVARGGRGRPTGHVPERMPESQRRCPPDAWARPGSCESPRTSASPASAPRGDGIAWSTSKTSRSSRRPSPRPTVLPTTSSDSRPRSASLTEQQRRAILLREWQGLSHREVADRLGLTQAAAETLIFRARRSLAAALENPGTRGRRSGLRALDLGGLITAIKGFLVGSAGVKTVAAVTVVAATTTTVVATDPAGVWRAQADPVGAKAAKSVVRATTTPPAASSGSIRVSADAALRSPGPRPGRSPRGEHASGRGRAFGQATAAAAKSKDKGTGNGLALGREKAAAVPKATKAQGPQRTAGRPSTRPGGPPAHAQAQGLGKDKGARVSHSR